MKHIARQLERVRRTSRLLLLLRRASQWIAVLVPVALALGLLDYLLRLPGMLRLGLGLIVLGVALAWLATRLARAYRFWPSIPELALRAERLYPQLAGSLASAVAFSSSASDFEEPRAHTNTATMARRAVDEAASKVGQVDLNRLIKTKPTLKAALVALLTLAVLGMVAGAAPTATSTAAQRWLLPLGDAQWPYRQGIESLTDDTVRPVDGKVRLRAKVTRGYAERMKMTIAYRVVEWDGTAGDWQRVRVAEQRSSVVAGERGVFETLVDVPAPVARSLMSGEQQGATLEYRFEAGDFTTDTAELTLAARPEVVSVVATITPPAYAQGLLREQTVPMHEQQDRIATASAYVGSRVELGVTFNKPIPAEAAQRVAAHALRPIDDPAASAAPPRWQHTDTQFHIDDAGDATGLTITLDGIKAQAEMSFALTDAYGLSSTDSDRQYRLQVINDEAPVVVLLEPMVDESVLPTATVALQAMAEDDIAMQALLLEVVVPDRANTGPDAEQLATRVLDDTGLLSTGRFGTLELQHTVDLGTLGLIPGDEVLVTAVGQDIYELEGQRHTPARSATRRLRVITEQELAEQVRRVLRGVRDTAQSLERSQRILSQRNRDGSDPAETAAQQGEVTGRVAAQREQVDALRDRLERNGAQDLGPLQDLLEQADRLLEDAQDASGTAQDALQQAEESRQRGAQAQQQQSAAQQAGDTPEAQAQAQAAAQAQTEQSEQQQQAGEAQEQVQRDLSSLVAALDMGESIGEVESALADLRRDAQRVAEETQELLPRTIGQDREDLPQELQDQLDRNAADQRAIGERAEALLDQMRSTAQQIAEQGEQQGATPQQRAAAQTMQEAAAVGERQGLEENTQQAAEELEENQVAEAATRQQQAQSTLEQMLAEMGKQQQRQQEELRRLLQELAQKVQKLIDDQQAELARVQQVQQVQPGGLAALEPALVQLRRRVMLVEEEAMASAETGAAGAALGKAVASQARAVRAMRSNDAGGAEAEESQALAHLQEALTLLNEAEQQQQQDQQRAERAALRQAYYDLAEKQEALRDAVGQHERDEPYGRRDWRQVNQLHADALGGDAFDAAQDAVRTAAQALGEQAGEAMVYQSLHRRIDQAADRAHTRLRERRADALVVGEQTRVALMLRAMGDALDDAGNPDKFEREQQQQQQQGGGEGGGQGEPPPLVPDLAEIKLLREVQIDLRRQTEMIDRLSGQLTPEELQQRLRELSSQQQELSELGEQLIEKLQAMVGDGPPMPEDRE